ncbi:hypothetical protein M2451_002930 [Dysgonomonas sp. PFB1-18]|uniref:type VI secretion system baseplate subunit TssG n=1 Tax=unclassified Dysgonomonas TaxID=2630389 RepID=UPI0013D2D1FE|nr:MULTISPECIES: type VI secretion system baseplate subunit TssG [unclassified Dysgonomonas]MDH6310040.1 hypothetical protein [Dysgonomonas sp. PF1-14]MDH6339949.1 hypothetical protein [Dysgonomonas sp. PF1-16]MDH6381597.1 hypothetical protein [Dysgonomonas sp. PFB1-18]MDH6398766.1 hypothetical protein [Dysgonomonas sp. PF1-23]NDV93611.1 hypothetical protein [Dysgonomonas sp. 521]
MKKSFVDINTIGTNFRAEVLASKLIESGSNAEKLLIVRHRGDRKEVSKDIDKVKYQYSEFDMMEYLYIYTNRHSIYDSLPEGLFHQTSSYGRTRSTESIIHEIKEQRGKELSIRKFFQPFEIAIDKLLIDAQAYEQKYDKAHFYRNLTDILKDYWNILKYLTTGQALLFIKIIPILEHTSADFDLMAKIMTVILDCPIGIRQGEKSRMKMDTQNCVKLKDWRLGINSVLGNDVEYAQPDLIVNVGPVSLQQMRLFESGCNNNLILKELINLMIPFNRNTIVRYQTNKSETRFRLSGEGHTAYLGINTTL